jgi:hypothetical protein
MKRPSLGRLGFAMLAPPIAWALHLCACYFIVTMGCETAWTGAGWAIALATLVFGAIAGAAGFIAWRDRPVTDPAHHENHQEDDSSSNARFIYRIGLIAAPVFVVAIVLAGVAPAFVARCV